MSRVVALDSGTHYIDQGVENRSWPYSFITPNKTCGHICDTCVYVCCTCQFDKVAPVSGDHRPTLPCPVCAYRETRQRGRGRARRKL